MPAAIAVAASLSLPLSLQQGAIHGEGLTAEQGLGLRGGHPLLQQHSHHPVLLSAPMRICFAKPRGNSANEKRKKKRSLWSPPR